MHYDGILLLGGVPIILGNLSPSIFCDFGSELNDEPLRDDYHRYPDSDFHKSACESVVVDKVWSAKYGRPTLTTDFAGSTNVDHRLR